MVIYRPSKLSYSDLGVTLANVAGVTGQVVRFLFNGSQYVIVERDVATNLLELNYWDTDGSQAVSRIMSKANIADICYDAADDRYYAIRWNDDDGFTGTPGIGWGPGTAFFDDFSVGSPTDSYKFLPSLWEESYPAWSAYSHNSSDPFGTFSVADTTSWLRFSRNPITEVLEYKTSTARGVLRSALTVDSDFQAYATVFVSQLPEDSTLSLRMVDESPVDESVLANNLVVQTTMRGPFDRTDPTKGGRWQSSHVYFDSDGTGGNWRITDFRLLDKHIDRALGGLLTNSGTGAYSGYEISFYDRAYMGGEYKHFFRMNQTSGGSVILASGTISSSVPQFSLVDAPFAFTLRADSGTDLNSAILVGSSIRINVRVDGPLVGTTSLAGTSISGCYIGVGRTGTNLYTRRDIDASGGAASWQDVRVYNLIPPTSNPNMAIELCGDAVGSTVVPDITADDVYIESTASGIVWSTIPSFSVEVYDTTGNIYVLPGVSDSEGYVIRRLNAINYSKESGGSFSDILSRGAVAITTDQKTSAQEGNVYILVKRSSGDPEHLFKFRKDLFPITALEDGGSADVHKYGSMDNPSLYRRGSFSYSSFSVGQLAYETANWADPTRGFFLSTLLSGTLSGTIPRHAAWLQSADYTAWNITDLDSLYGTTITGSLAGKVFLFNMTPTQPAFCNVVSRKRTFDAGTGETGQVVAQVMNVYGEPLSGKQVSFTVSAGDGSLAPAVATTNVSGEAFTTYTVGVAVTTSTITAAVNI